MRTTVRTRRRMRVLAVLAASGLGLLGCTVGPTPVEVTTSPAPSTPEPAPSTESPSPEAGSGVGFDVEILECSSLITDEEAQGIFLPEFAEGVGPSSEFQEEYRKERMGPAALAALDKAVEFRSCVWGVPLSDLVEHLFVAELPKNVTQELLADLRSSSYVESRSADVALFTYTFGKPELHNWYGFSGEVWVGSFGQRGAAPVEAVFGNLRASNPEWEPSAP